MSDTKVYVKEVGVDTINFQEVDGETLGTKVVANPVLTGDEPKLTGLQVGDNKYSVSDVGEITIEATQFISDTQARLTNEQVEILLRKPIIIANIPTGTVTLTRTLLGNHFILSGALVLDGQNGLAFVTVTSDDILTNIVYITTRIVTGLPLPTNSDNGKVLTASANGEVSWETPVSGGLTPKTVTVVNNSSGTVNVYTNKGILSIPASNSGIAYTSGIIGLKLVSATASSVSDNLSYIANALLSQTEICYFGIAEGVTQLSIYNLSGGGGGS